LHSTDSYESRPSEPRDSLLVGWWRAGSLTFTSTDISTGVFDVKIDAASVNTGSGLKNGTLKGPEFFDVKNNPVISFRSTKISQTGSNTFAVTVDFTVRGVSRPQASSRGRWPSTARTTA
jgi:hypothetical protein